MNQKQTYTLEQAEQVLTKPKGLWAALAILFWAKRLSVWIANKTRITPNQLTAVSFVVALMAAACFYQGHYYLLLVTGAVLFQVNYLLDCVDGTVARLKKQSSAVGAYLDPIVDSWRIPFCIAALALTHYRIHHNIIIFLIALLYTSIKFIRAFSWSSELGVLLKCNCRIVSTSLALPETKGPYACWLRFCAARNLNPWPRGVEVDLIVFTIGPLINQIYWCMIIGCVVHFIVWLSEVLAFVVKISSNRNERRIVAFFRTYKVQTVAVFGTGLAAEHFADWLASTNLTTEIVRYIDNNPDKQGTVFRGLDVTAADSLSENRVDLVVITSKAGYHEIVQQLTDTGMQENRDFIYANFS